MSHPPQPANASSSTHNKQVGGKTVVPLSPTGNPVEIRGDNAMWDTVANKFVNISYTNVGTTSIPKL